MLRRLWACFALFTLPATLLAQPPGKDGGAYGVSFKSGKRFVYGVNFTVFR